jgi:hypothetical protein
LTTTFDRTILWKSALLQLLAVAIVSTVLGLLLPTSFFETWGWVSGPLAWLACAAFTATVLGLDLPRTVLGAALAGLPSVIFVVIGLHWLGALFAALLFALWCARGAATGRLARGGTRPATGSGPSSA